MQEEKICIVGAGLVGSLLSLYMARNGYDVEVLERRPDMRKAKLSAGRSINLALSDRGWKALEQVGAADSIREIAIPMSGRMIHDLSGEKSFMQYGQDDQAIYSVSRGELNKRLMEMAEQTGKVNFRFNQRCEDVDLDAPSLLVEDTLSGSTEKRSYSRIIGTDGAFSAIRSRMMKNDRFNYWQFYIESGYKELTIPPVEGAKWALDKNSLHIWPRGKFMLIALPNMDGSFTCTLFFDFEGELSFDSIKTPEDVEQFFNEQFKSAVPHMPTLIEDYFENATSSLVTIRCAPWNYQDKVLIMGDASHAIVPFYGQGMNSGFEDCSIFNSMLNAHKGDWASLFEEFSKTRKPDADAISELALNNFIEMRDLVADEHFVTKRALSTRIHEMYGDRWIPLYSMVTFSHMPYSEALRKGKEQDALLEKLVAQGAKADLEDGKLRELVDQLIG